MYDIIFTGPRQKLDMLGVGINIIRFMGRWWKGYVFSSGVGVIILNQRA